MNYSIVMEKVRSSVLHLSVAVATIFLSACEAAINTPINTPIINSPAVRLIYQKHFDIQFKAEGLREPSGLALSSAKDALWTISDDTKQIFQLDLRGDLQQNWLI